MMPHCSLAFRSRNWLGSSASALATGMAKNTYTGMNTVKKLKRAVATSMNWIGSTTKKASSRLRWSPRRVGESVMNSRSARKAMSANSTVATVSPRAQPIQKITTMNQVVRSRPRKWRSSSCQSSPCTGWRRSRSVRRKAAVLTIASRPKTTTKSAATCWVALRLRRKLSMSGSQR